ncbi:hypothetical protein F8M41_003152 [Gigaspora margarita]|uniref:Uncharacterized protein n=1 Tax=Gigaspora margarita TaxID=4874 RepID=A0A8H3XBR6_GIGMA|nr:hypothetical protein F8M41_003152 [Gigaspora margarita]
MASDEREVCWSFDGHNSVFDSSGNTVLSSVTCHSSENNACRSFGGYDDISRHTILRPFQTRHSFKNNMSLSGSTELNDENTVSDSLNLNLNLSQVIISDSSDFHKNVALELSQEYYSDYHSSEAYLPNLSLYSPAYAFSSSFGPIFNQQDNYHSQLQIEYSNLVELSDSSSQSESDDDNITS